MNVVIVEDEPLVARNLGQLLHEIDASIQIDATLGSIKEAVKWLKSNHTDLIFLDIHLSDGNSFRIFDEVQVNTPVIITTSYDKYAIEAFNLWSISYILKPVSIEALQKSMEKFHRIQSIQQMDVTLDELKRVLKHEPPMYKKRFMVHFGSKIRSVNTTDIAYFFIQDRSVFLCDLEGKRYPVDYSLDQLEAQLDPDNFFRINRKMLVSHEAIENMYYLSPGSIGLEVMHASKEDSSVSLSRTTRFKKWLNC